MLDILLLSAVRRKNEQAIEQLMDKYAAYVCVVIRNTVGESLTREDIEEVASDVFFTLWENAGKVEKLKGWLGTTARNKAINKLREIRNDISLDNTIITDDGETPEDNTILEYEQHAVKSAINLLDSPDKEIFTMHYYESQTVAAIAKEAGMTEAAIKQRLVRGREKIKTFLINQEVFI
ncbi:MAG: sigma-70 family RNA polymerase sigma factor [Oscillospiraceae bacterium]|jgi:RNA polymerase sigma-70 factor (ECF subfamily)|nr:sigma-70 family RNA polymerase sigma factor [Oscillospiraceae bacterium]